MKLALAPALLRRSRGELSLPSVRKQPVFFSRSTAPSKMIKIALGSALASLAAAAPIQKDAPIVSGDGELLPSGARSSSAAF